MKLSYSFPLNVINKGLYRALSLSACLLLVACAAFATGNPKTAAPARPVARLVSTSRQEVPARSRARILAIPGMLPASTRSSSSRVRPAAVVVTATSDERRAFDLINAERRAHGHKPLIWDGELTHMARFHSENMARQNFFNHVDKDGLSTAGRADALGVQGWRALGENIAYNQGYDDPVAFAVERWMRSDKHRDNILSSEFTHAGLGVARAADGRVFFTQVFVTR